jgi:hypothetical protein
MCLICKDGGIPLSDDDRITLMVELQRADDLEHMLNSALYFVSGRAYNSVYKQLCRINSVYTPNCGLKQNGSA